MPGLDSLWEPCEIGPVTVPNRICVPAHQTQFPIEEDDLVGDRYIAYLEERARGGAGMIVVEAGGVHPSTAKVGLINAYREEIVPGFTRLAEAVHAHGAKLFAQLSHLGSQELGTSNLDRVHPVIAPSNLPSVVYGRVAQEMEESDIASVVDGYAQTAANAQTSGLDGGEISAGHGYLMTQFLSPMSNRRTDGYGGSVENRCRFAIEAAEAIRERCGSDFALGIRLSFDEFLGPVAITPELSVEIVRILHARGLFDYYSVTAGNYHTIRQWVPSASGGLDGHLAPHSALLLEAVNEEAPVMVASAIRKIERAAEIVDAGQADLVAMMRAHIADPAIVEKARSGRADEIRPCVGANQGCLRRLFDHNMITCTVNPAAGREQSLGSSVVTRTDAPRSVLV
ncbi:MAG: FAD-dependent oxidoreductase, partial [Solirubrobacterales bacterium]